MQKYKANERKAIVVVVMTRNESAMQHFSFFQGT